MTLKPAARPAKTPVANAVREVLTEEEARALLANLHTLTLQEQYALLDDLERFEKVRTTQACKDDFLFFCKHVYPEWKEGPHHRFLKPILHDVVEGTEDRLTVSMPPRFGKSETIAYLFVAWYLGHHPEHYVIMVTHTANLSASFGRKVRDLIESPVYQEIFPGTRISKDKTASDDWVTTKGGKYLAIGVGGSVAGYGAHLLIADDLCVHEDAMLVTRAGLRPAHSVHLGDLILGAAGWVQVKRRTDAQHTVAVGLDGGVPRLSFWHPVWTFNRGWQYAGELRARDLLKTTSVYDKIKSSLRRAYVKTSEAVRGLQARVQHLGADEAALPQPQGGELCQLRSQGGDGGAGVRALRGLLSGAWARAYAAAHIGPNRQQFGVQRCELPLGGRAYAAEQPHERCSLRARGAAIVGTTAGPSGGFHARPHDAPVEEAWDDSGASYDIPENELGAASRCAADFGWAVHTAVCLFGSGRNGRDTNAVGARENAQNHVAGNTPAQSLLGILVGVRRLKSVELTTLSSDHARFINFEVSGDSTFYADGVLTHNCSEQAVLANPDVAFENAWNYMQVGPMQRLMPGGRCIMIGTRWGKKDPIGRALNWALDDPHQKKWHEIRFPAILPSGKSLWPEQWPVDQLLAKKASMQPQFWAAQYVQEPTSEEGALLKRGWWRIWTDPRPPQVEFIIQSWDTAHETKTTNDYSACITWGVWFNEETNRRELIMLDAFKDRWEFPQLKEKAFKAYKQWEPEALIIEKKASGAPLIQEMRQMDIVVEEFSPSRGRGGVSNDKRARVNSVAPILMDGICWIPDRKWATDVVEECAEFPNGEFDDYVDAVTLALMRYRLGGFVILSTDRKEVEIVRAPRRRAYY